MTEEKQVQTENAAKKEPRETAGALLKRARLAKKQNLRDIASYLCIRYQFLEALEEGDYKELPGEAYANGFIRTYASYLGLDPMDIMSRFKSEFYAAQHQDEARSLSVSEEEAENMMPAPKILVASVILLLGAYWFFHISAEKQNVSVPSTPVVTVVDETPADESIRIVEDVYPLPASVETREIAEPVPPVPPVKPAYKEDEPDLKNPSVVKGQGSNVKQSAEPVAAESAVTEQSVPVAREPRIFGMKNYNPRLVLVAVENVWIEVTRNDMILFSRLMQKGDSYRVSSYNPQELTLKTGNAGGLEIYLDEMPTMPLGPRGSLRSNVPLTVEYFEPKLIKSDE